MDVNNLKKYLDDKGQAFFEMIVFVPFMLFLFTLIITFGNSVNSAINQNKILRGYFYHFTKHDSFAPSRQTLRDLAGSGITRVGLYSIGYRTKEEGASSLAPCFRVNKFFGGDITEECDEPPVDTEVTNFVRVFTFYGVCTANYSDDGEGRFENQDFFSSSLESCLNRN